MIRRRTISIFLCSALAIAAATSAYAADWTIARSSGDVQIKHDGATAAALGNSDAVRAGDHIVTGPNGRVMLVRGAESIIVAPNTELIVPKVAEETGRTTLLQSHGRVEFEVEKRNVKHFSVETPYLAAVVKGTHFVVDVTATGATVSVDRGIVEVFDFDTGQVGLVTAGQRAATSSAPGAGLSLAGSGRINALEQREPRESPFETSPLQERQASLGIQKASDQQALNIERQAERAESLPAQAAGKAIVSVGSGVRIASPIGERALSIGQVSNGLALSSVEQRQAKQDRKRIVGAGVNLTSINDDSGGAYGNGNAYGQGNGNANGNGNAYGQGNGNGAGNGNAYGQGNGNGAGNGNAYGQGNGKGQGKGNGDT